MPSFPPPTGGGFRGQYPLPARAIKNGWATTSLTLGILSFIIPLLAPIGAIIAGIVGLSKTHDPRVRGRGIAITGICLGGVGLVLMTPAILIALLLPNLSHARAEAQRIRSAANLHQIGMAAVMYSNDNRGWLPSDPAMLVPYLETPTVFIHPRRQQTMPAMPKDPDQLPQWIASNSDYLWIAHGKLQSVPNPADVVMAHEKLGDDPHGINVLYCDSHVDYLPLPEANLKIQKSQQVFQQLPSPQ
jgi:hypothetical protein